MQRHKRNSDISSTYAEWMWRSNPNPFLTDEPEEWRSYSEEESKIIEAAYMQEERQVKLENYKIDFTHFVQVSLTDRNRQRPVKRVEHDKGNKNSEKGI